MLYFSFDPCLIVEAFIIIDMKKLQPRKNKYESPLVYWLAPSE